MKEESAGKKPNCREYEDRQNRLDGQIGPAASSARGEKGNLGPGFAFTEATDGRRQGEEILRELSRTVEALSDEVRREAPAEQTLRESPRQLRALASALILAEHRERQRLAQGIHDGLQQILVATKIRLGILERSPNKEMQDAAREVGNLISDSIETARSLTAELSPPMLREGGLISAIESLVRWMHEKQGLFVDLQVHGHVEPAAEDVTVLLFQATRELLCNVSKHAGVETALVRVTPSDDQLQVVVTDKGVGFDPMQLRAKGGRVGGFGLSSIQQRLSLLGGRMEIDSAPDRGSRITLIAPLPKLTQHAAAPADCPPKVPVGMTSPRGVPADGAEVKIRVVLVDDHTVVRQGLARLLREEPDMEIVGEASDGESAINLIRAVRPDVVLMDISMPRMNGIEATRIVHSELPDVRIIGLSMFEEEERAAAMRAAGATDYLSKSGPAHAVVDVIRSCSRPSGARNNAVETIKRAEPRMPAGLKVRRGNGRKPPPKSR